MARDGATPTILGPSPLNRALVPSVSTMIRKHCIILIDVAFDDILHDEMARTCCGRRFNIVEQNLLRCSECRRVASKLLFPDGPLLEKRGGRKADELCNRVFTTSNGHVTIAPTVPATLKIKEEKKNDELL